MAEFKTDFIPVPYMAIKDKNLDPSSRIILGLIYYISEKRGEKFFMSNKYIGDVLNYTSGSVANGLNKLESTGYIIRTFKDDKKRNRLEIVCNVQLTKVTSNETRDTSNKSNDTLNNVTNDTSNDEQNKISINKEITKQETFKRFEKFYNAYIEKLVTLNGKKMTHRTKTCKTEFENAYKKIKFTDELWADLGEGFSKMVTELEDKYHNWEMNPMGENPYQFVPGMTPFFNQRQWEKYL